MFGRCLEISMYVAESIRPCFISPCLPPSIPRRWQDTATPDAYAGKAQHKLRRTHLISLTQPLTSHPPSLSVTAPGCLPPCFPPAALQIHPSPSSLLLQSYTSPLHRFLHFPSSTVFSHPLFCVLSFYSPAHSSFVTFLSTVIYNSLFSPLCIWP